MQQFGSWALSNMALSGDDIARKIKKRGVLEVGNLTSYMFLLLAMFTYACIIR